MSAPVKIAAIRHAVSALHGCADDVADTRSYADSLRQLGTALDELIEACAPFVDPDPLGDDDRITGDLLVQLRDIRRLEAAVARVRGAA